MTEIKLPTKLSACVRLALEDLRAVEKAKKTYKIEMNRTYHSPNITTKQCIVCFAGAVMAKTMNLNPKQDLEPSDFNYHNRARLYALDHLREGNVESAFQEVGREFPYGLAEHVVVEQYEYDPLQFKADMKRIANLLEKLGE